MTDLPKWKSLKNEPPGPEHTMFFVGHSRGGRRDYVFRCPHPKTGEMVFWCRGEVLNYILYDYKPDVWYPGPPTIPGSAADHADLGWPDKWPDNRR